MLTTVRTITRRAINLVCMTCGGINGTHRKGCTG